MIEPVKRKSWINIFYIFLIVFILLLNIFTNKLSVFLYIKPNLPETNSTRIHFVNVGQGDAIIIELSNGETMLIDSGTKVYKNKLFRYLDNIVLDNKKIDYAVLTHPDADHSGNMLDIINRYAVGTFYRPPIFVEGEVDEGFVTNEDYSMLLKALKDKDIKTIINDDNLRLDMSNNSHITWLYPDTSDLYGDLSTGTNIYSAVIMLEDNGKKALFTGDIDSTTEMSLINLYGEDILDIDILKVAHHGSAGSTSGYFLETTTPEIAVISVGDNSYGHPSQTLISRVLDYDSVHNRDLYDNLYRTDILGNIIVTMDKDLSIHTIDNIDNYSFVPLWVYTLVIDIVLSIILFKPYLSVAIKKLRFYLQNKKNKESRDNIK